MSSTEESQIWFGMIWGLVNHNRIKKCCSSHKHIHTCSTVTSSFLYLYHAFSLRVGLYLSVISSVSPCLSFPGGRRQINVREWLASSTSAESERWVNLVNCEGETAPCSKETVQISIPPYLPSLSVPRDGSQDAACNKHKPGQASWGNLCHRGMFQSVQSKSACAHTLGKG